MVCSVIAGLDALDNLNNNALSSWPSRTLPNNRVEPICRPGLAPSFLLQPGEAVFTTGSCFARNVEDALHAKGFNVVTRDLEGFGPEFFELRRGLINNYGITSMFNDLSWALDPADAFDEPANFYPMGRNKFVDLHLASRIRPAPIEAVRERRRLMTTLAKRVVTASTVIMTLGLAEVWYDKDHDRYLNYAPPKTAVAKEPDRFQLRILDYDTAIDYIRRSLVLIRKTSEVPKKIVITVSPVPLIRTFTNQDVVIANCYSKSLLRVVAETITRENEDCDYYPSYESITLSNRRVAWNDDMIHVHDAIVAVNVKRMVDAYAPAGEEPSPGIEDEWSLEGVEGEDAERHDSASSPAAPDVELVFHDADRLAEAGRVDDAVALIKAADIPDDDWSSRLRAAVAIFSMRDAEGAYAMLSTMLDTQLVGVQRVIAIRHLVPMAVATKRIDEAVKLCREWGTIQSKSGQAHLTAARILRDEARLAEAETLYRSALEAEPGSRAAKAGLASLLTKTGRHREGLRLLGTLPEENINVAALTVDPAGATDATVALSEEDVARIARDNEAIFVAVEQYSNGGHFAEAAERLRGIKLIPGDWKLKLKVATALHSAKDAEGAYHMLKALLDDELVGMPRVLAYRVFVAAAAETGRTDEAIDACKQWGAMHKGVNQGYLAGAQILSAAGRTSEAEAWFRHALEIDPESNAAKVQFSRFLSQIGKRREALRLLGQLDEPTDTTWSGLPERRSGVEAPASPALRSDPATLAVQAEDVFREATVQLESGRHDEAAGLLKTLSIAPTDWKSKLKAASLLLSARDGEAAYRLVKTALDNDLIGMSRIFGLRAFTPIAAATGRVGEALDACRELSALQAGSNQSILAGAQILKHEGRAEDAEAWFRHALELDPDSQPAKIQYGRFLNETGRRRDAQQLLGKPGDRRAAIPAISRSSAVTAHPSGLAENPVTGLAEQTNTAKPGNVERRAGG